ncbi:MAG: hypothetical protein IVW57_18120, partial [Ktedonobacterales bacterium]|nr:hypothetical protein [Ktedonobacterales bacterium]
MARARKLHDRWRRIRGVGPQDTTRHYARPTSVGDYALARASAPPSSAPGADDGEIPTPPAPLAAIDAGSNTIHLVVAELTADGRDLRPLDDRLELVRLGADVSATGAIGAARAARAIEVIGTQAERARRLGAATVLGIATEGVRAATNAAVFLRRIAAETGVRLTLVTGEQEAALTYWGVTGDEAAPAGPRA